MGYTLAEAIERIGPDWARLIPPAERQVLQNRQEAAYAEAERIRQEQLAKIRDAQAAAEVIDLNATLVTHGQAPGYRDVHLTFDLVPVGIKSERPIRVEMHISARDGERIAQHIIKVHRFAWGRGRPIDATPDENRPSWIQP